MLCRSTLRRHVALSQPTVALSLLLAASSAHAAQSVGVAASVIGKAKILRDGKEIPATSGRYFGQKTKIAQTKTDLLGTAAQTHFQNRCAQV